MKCFETTSLIGQEDSAFELCEINQRIESLKNMIKELEKKKAFFERGFKDQMQDKDIGILDGYEILWKRTTRKSFQQKKLQEENPDLYERFVEEVPVRRFVIKRTREQDEDEIFDF